MDNNTDTVNVEQNVEEETTKTYTKEDLDNSFNAGVKKANSEWQKDEKYKEFIEWKKTNQNDSEKLVQLQTDNENLIKENKTLRITNEIVKYDVKPEFVKFVTSEIMNSVDNTNDYGKVLENYKKENPQYFKEVVVKKVQSSPALTGGENKPQNANSIMNDILRNAKK